MKSICMPIIIKFHRLGSFPNVSGAATAGRIQTTTHYPYGEPHRPDAAPTTDTSSATRSTPTTAAKASSTSEPGTSPHQ